ncbi:MAG: hypothetical protein ABJB33_08380 [Gemmatimonadota bacterium]
MSVPATAEGLPAVPESVRGGYARTWARRLGRIRESKPALIGVCIISFWVARMGEPYTPLPRQDARAAQGLSKGNRTGLIVVAAVAGIVMFAIIVKGIEGWNDWYIDDWNINDLKFACTPPDTC